MTISESIANQRDLDSGINRIGKWVNATTKTEYICSICNNIWLVKPVDVWNGHKGHHTCTHNINYEKYIGETINNCTLLKIDNTSNPRKINVNCLCNICGNNKTIDVYHLLNNGNGCCVNQIYQTLDIDILHNTIYNRHKFSVKYKNRFSEINKSSYIKLIYLPCEYPGCTRYPYIKKIGDFFVTKVNSVDRIDSFKGYYIDNIGILCSGHNMMKRDLIKSELIELEPKWEKYFNLQRKY
jgi:hypothetical protein